MTSSDQRTASHCLCPCIKMFKLKSILCLVVAVYKWKDIRNDLVVSSIADTVYTLWSIDCHDDKPSPIVQL